MEYIVFSIRKYEAFLSFSPKGIHPICHYVANYIGTVT